MEKEIGKIVKNDTTDIILRVDDFGGKRGLTIREFVSSDRYTGFTKAGVRISAADFLKFRELINSIDLDEMQGTPDAPAEGSVPAKKSYTKKQKTLTDNSGNDELPDY